MGGKNGCELVISAATISDEESESSQKRDEPPLRFMAWQARKGLKIK
jgi:hypothetical protein